MRVPGSLAVGRLRRGSAAAGGADGLTAPVRLDRRTRSLAARLDPGDIAVIDHVDLDRGSAEALLARGVRAVLNTARGISGRYPNLGPQTLAEAGVILVDAVDPEIFTRVEEGERLRLADGVLYRGDIRVAAGTVQDPGSVAAAMAEARAGISVHLESFAANTMEYARREHALLIDGIGVPDISTRIEGRHVLIAVRGYRYREDLAALRPYIGDYRPVMIGVDGGADALLEAGYRPGVIVGDLDSLSDKALACGAELVAHTCRAGRSASLKRVHDLGRDAVVFPVAGTSEDAALLLADGRGADLIVTAGSHATFAEFLDKGRAGMPSAFLTRLRVGGKLVDAAGASRLYRSRISPWSLLGLAAAALAAIAAAVYSAPAGAFNGSALAAHGETLRYWLLGLLP